MATLADSLVSSASRPLNLRKRPDLRTKRHMYQGHPYIVIKEPVGLKYYRFQEEEFAILEMIDGKTSLEEIKDEFERRFDAYKREVVKPFFRDHFARIDRQVVLVELHRHAAPQRVGDRRGGRAG